MDSCSIFLPIKPMHFRRIYVVRNALTCNNENSKLFSVGGPPDLQLQGQVRGWWEGEGTGKVEKGRIGRVDGAEGRDGEREGQDSGGSVGEKGRSVEPL